MAEGRIRYHAAKRNRPRSHRRRRPRRAARRPSTDARRLRQSLERPPIADNERLCAHCSLAPVCLPEEVRQEREPEREPVAPVSARPRRRHAPRRLPRAPGRLSGRHPGRPAARPAGDANMPYGAVDTVLLHGFAQLTTQALRLCVEHGVGVHWLTTSGHHTASIVPTAGQVQRRIRQYRALTDEATCLRLAKALVHAKVEGQHRYLLRATSRRQRYAAGSPAPSDRDPGSPCVACNGAADRDSLRGHEGQAARALFPGSASCLGEQVPEELRSDDTQPASAAGPLQRPVELRLWPAAHGGDAGGAGRRAWSRPWVFSTRRGVRPIRSCST